MAGIKITASEGDEKMSGYLKNIKLDEEKLKSVSFYAEQKETDFSLQNYLQKTIDEAVNKLFRKYVPKQVREYIDKTGGNNE